MSETYETLEKKCSRHVEYIAQLEEYNIDVSNALAKRRKENAKLEAERDELKKHNEYLVKTHAKIVSAFADKNNPHSAMIKIGKALGIYHEVNNE